MTRLDSNKIIHIDARIISSCNEKTEQMVLIFKEKISVYKLSALGLAVLGILFLIEFNLTLNLVGTILVLSSGLAFGIYLISVDKSQYRNLDPCNLIFYLGTINLIFFGVQGCITGTLEIIPVEGIVFVVGTGTLTIIALLFLTEAIRIIGPIYTSIISIFELVVTWEGKYLEKIN